MNATVYALALHCAYRVTTSPDTVEIIDPTAPSSYGSPDPSAAVFHPANALCSYVNAFSGSLCDVPYSNVASGMSPSPPFASNNTVNVLALHTA